MPYITNPLPIHRRAGNVRFNAEPVYAGPQLKDQTPSIEKTGAIVPPGLREHAVVPPGAAVGDCYANPLTPSGAERAATIERARIRGVIQSASKRSGVLVRHLLDWLYANPGPHDARTIASACGCCTSSAKKYLAAYPKLVIILKRKGPHSALYWHREHDQIARATLERVEINRVVVSS